MVCRNGLFGQLVLPRSLFHLLVGRSVFRSVGQADGSCLDSFYVGRGLDALEDKERLFGQGSPAYMMLSACVFLVFN